MRSLDSYKPICSALALLQPGLIEVVLHDLETGCIAHIENGRSLRAVGDSSLLDTQDYRAEMDATGVIGPYLKYLPDGGKQKSVSVVLRDSDGEAFAMICINMRLDTFEALHSTLSLLMGDSLKGEAINNALTRNDWREIANAIISEQLMSLKVSLANAKRSQRLIIVQKLYQSGVFDARGSIDYVSSALGISRANLYNLIKSSKRASTP